MHTKTFSTTEGYELFVDRFSRTVEIIAVTAFEGKLIVTYRNVSR